MIGEPGVGKTAVIEALAARIAEGDVPDTLLDKRLMTLDLSGMVAGSKYRGEFEERIKRLIAEVKNDGGRDFDYEAVWNDVFRDGEAAKGSFYIIGSGCKLTDIGEHEFTISVTSIAILFISSFPILKTTSLCNTDVELYI